jgi:hypothetical protein
MARLSISLGTTPMKWLCHHVFSFTGQLTKALAMCNDFVTDLTSGHESFLSFELCGKWTPILRET